MLAREVKANDLPGVPIAIVRSQDPALNDLFLCIVHPHDAEAVDETREKLESKKRKRVDPKGDVESAMHKVPLAARAAAKYEDELCGKKESEKLKGGSASTAAKKASDSDESSSDEEETRKPRTGVNPRSDKADFMRLPLGSFFEPLPCMNKTADDKPFRTTAYGAGKGGSGKSIYFAGILRRYHSLWPERPIYGVCKTPLKDDPAYADIPIHQIPVSAFQSVGKTFDVKEWFGDQGCMTLFDDWDSLEPKEKVPVCVAIKDILNVGRKLQVSACITSHLLNNYNETRGITNECNYITIFPRAVLYDQMYYMANKTGVPKEVIKRFKEKGRWVTIHTSDPTYVLSETEAEMI